RHAGVEEPWQPRRARADVVGASVEPARASVRRVQLAARLGGVSPVSSGQNFVVCVSPGRDLFGDPIRRNQRKCAATPARKDLYSMYLTPKSRHVSSTSLEIAG